MKFDYTSDLHLDFYFNKNTSVKDSKVKKIFDNYFQNKSSDYLIIAGDIGHYPKQNVEIVNKIKDMYGYKDIFTVEGNHSGYMVSKNHRFRYKNNGLNKILDHMKLLEDSGIKTLNGNYYEINDAINDKIITIGGANSWYDGTIYYRMMTGWYNSSGNIENHWKDYMNDSKYINIEYFYDLAMQEKNKLKSLKDKCDIIVTHVKPVVENRYFQDRYKGDISNAYYSFDFIDNIAEDTKLKYWVYGHIHETEEWDVFGKKLLSNAFGYPDDRNKQYKSILSFDV